jgi:cell division protein FtsW
MKIDLHKNFVWRWWRGIDQQTIIALALLFAFSLMLVTTASPAVAMRIGLEESYFSSRQVAYLLMAATIIFSLSFMERHMIKRAAIIGFLLSFILLILVKFFGYDVKGARRWISVFGFSMQPSEFVKPCFAVVTAWILALRESHVPSFSISIVLYSLLAVVLITQPDFGMLIMITMVWGIQLFVSGLPILWILIAIISGIVGVFSAYTMLPHVAQRINSFLDPAGSENYQVTKSIAAFANGGLYGRGPGEGSVKQVLPDSHTDFIFAVAGEEFGAVVCLIIAAIFAFIVIRGLVMLVYEEDRFTILASVGLLAQFGLQSVINMGVTLNLLPTKGMTLPFISYGGSSTLSVAVGMGMLLALTRQHASLTKYKAQILAL